MISAMCLPCPVSRGCPRTDRRRPRASRRTRPPHHTDLARHAHHLRPDHRCAADDLLRGHHLRADHQFFGHALRRLRQIRRETIFTPGTVGDRQRPCAELQHLLRLLDADRGIAERQTLVGDDAGGHQIGREIGAVSAISFGGRFVQKGAVLDRANARLDAAADPLVGVDVRHHVFMRPGRLVDDRLESPPSSIGADQRDRPWRPPRRRPSP